MYQVRDCCGILVLSGSYLTLANCSSEPLSDDSTGC